MEDLEDILKRQAIRGIAEYRVEGVQGLPAEQPEPCDRCGGRGWVTLDVPVGHPEFGQVITCDCQEQKLEREQSDRLVRYSNLGLLTRFTFDNLEHEGWTEDPESRALFKAAYQEAEQYAESPTGWLVFAGPHGSGKTHLAAAIGNRCIEKGHVVLFTDVPDLLDHLRASFGPGSDTSYSDLFDQVRSTPLLILDGLGGHSATPWAEEKLRQIINQRYNSQLPTIVTTARDLSEVDPYILSRLKTPGLSRVLEVEGRSRDRAGGLGRIEPRMLRRMTFKTFDVRGNNPSANQRRSLEQAYNFARNYASDPEGWLVLIGDTGVGKTHLAVAVASERLKAGHSVFFSMVADLLDHLRAAFGPNSTTTYDQRFEEVKNTPLLILDDLDKEHMSSWAEEKLRQIIAHRHNARLPTVITSMVDFRRPEERGPIGSRIQDPDVGELFKMDAPDYRAKQLGRQGVCRGKPRGPASS